MRTTRATVAVTMTVLAAAAAGCGQTERAVPPPPNKDVSVTVTVLDLPLLRNGDKSLSHTRILRVQLRDLNDALVHPPDGSMLYVQPNGSYVSMSWDTGFSWRVFNAAADEPSPGAGSVYKLPDGANLDPVIKFIYKGIDGNVDIAVPLLNKPVVGLNARDIGLNGVIGCFSDDVVLTYRAESYAGTESGHMSAYSLTGSVIGRGGTEQEDNGKYSLPHPSVAQSVDGFVVLTRFVDAKLQLGLRLEQQFSSYQYVNWAPC